MHLMDLVRYHFHCCTGKRVSSTSASPAGNNNLDPTGIGHNPGGVPDPCNATLDAIMLGMSELLLGGTPDYWDLIMCSVLQSTAVFVQDPGGKLTPSAAIMCGPSPIWATTHP